MQLALPLDQSVTGVVSISKINKVSFLVCSLSLNEGLAHQNMPWHLGTYLYPTMPQMRARPPPANPKSLLNVLPNTQQSDRGVL